MLISKFIELEESCLNFFIENMVFLQLNSLRELRMGLVQIVREEISFLFKAHIKLLALSPVITPI
ncbi:hypothetical protein D3C85_1715420 [compost metagenome]